MLYIINLHYMNLISLTQFVVKFITLGEGNFMDILSLLFLKY